MYVEDGVVDLGNGAVEVNVTWQPGRTDQLGNTWQLSMVSLQNRDSVNENPAAWRKARTT
jgi:hypothetical protein